MDFRGFPALRRLPGISIRLALALCLVIAGACGGGGGSSGGNGDDNKLVGGDGGGDGSGGGGGGTSGVPATAPAAPVPSYAGNRSRASFDDENAGALADAAWLPLFFLPALLEGVTDVPFPPGQVIDETFPGTNSGTLRIAGRIATNGTGFLIFDYDDFSDGPVTWTGRNVIERLTAGVPTLRVSFHDLRVTSSFVDYTYSGHLTRTPVPGTSGITLSGSFSLRDNNAAVALFTEDFSIRHGQGPGAGKSIEAAGRAYDSHFGYMDFELDEPLQIRAAEDHPYAGGPVVGTGAGNRMLRLSLIDEDAFSLEYVPAGETSFLRSARLTGERTFETQTKAVPTAAPVADAGASRSVAPGTEIALDSRYSVHPQNAFLDYQWEVVFRPPGSTASPSDARATQPTMTLDVEGSYLLRLTATDGSRANDDYVVVTADVDILEGMPTNPRQLTPDEVVATPGIIHVADDVGPRVLDGMPPGWGNLSLNGPASGEITWVDTGYSAFNATVPGIYTLSLWRSTGREDVKRIAVGIPLLFIHPPASIETGFTNGTVSAGDLDGDGHTDLVASGVFYVPPGNTPVFQLKLYYGDGNGGFREPMTLTGGSAGTTTIADINGDGLSDIVTGGSDIPAGIDLFIQQADGSFQVEWLELPCTGNDRLRTLFVKDMNGDGRVDIVDRSICSGAILTFLQNAGGDFGAPMSTAVTVTDSTGFAVGDFDGDGIHDVVTGTSVAPYYIALFRGQPDGTLLPAESLPIVSHNSIFVTGDINGDGRDDLVFTTRPQGISGSNTHVYLQNDVGQLESVQVISDSRRAEALRLHDFDGDGRPDIAQGCLGILCIRFQGIDGSFGDSRREGSLFPEAIADVDGNGYRDLIRTRPIPNRRFIEITFARPPAFPQP